MSAQAQKFEILLWNQVKSRMEACYSELILTAYCPDIYTVGVVTLAVVHESVPLTIRSLSLVESS